MIVNSSLIYACLLYFSGGDNRIRTGVQGVADLYLSHSIMSPYFKKVVPRRGIEPPTQGFSVPCSTD